jgi:hypothetical protein
MLLMRWTKELSMTLPCQLVRSPTRRSQSLRRPQSTSAQRDCLAELPESKARWPFPPKVPRTTKKYKQLEYGGMSVFASETDSTESFYNCTYGPKTKGGPKEPRYGHPNMTDLDVEQRRNKYPKRLSIMYRTFQRLNTRCKISTHPI